MVKCFGFGTLELFIMIAIISMVAILVSARVKLTNNTISATNNAAKIHSIAIKVANYINAHRNYIENNVPLTLNFQSYDDTRPCISIFMQNNELTAWLFFVTNDKKSTHDLNYMNQVVNRFATSAGIYNNGQVIMNHDSFTVNTQLFNPNACQAKYIASNSIFLNLIHYIGAANKQDRLSLERIRDYTADINTSNNANTLQTDIAFAKSNARMQFNNQSELSITDTTTTTPTVSVTTKNGFGKLKVNALQPTSSATAGTICNSEEVGSIILAATNGFVSALQLDILVCSYNQVFCHTNHHYCYLPIRHIAINMHGSFGDTVDCQQMFGPDFFLDIDSVKLTKARQPPDWPGICCRWDDHPARYSNIEHGGWVRFLPTDVVKIPYSAKYVAYFEGHWNGDPLCPSMCNIWPSSTWTNAMITDFVCSNDLSKYVIRE